MTLKQRALTGSALALGSLLLATSTVMAVGGRTFVVPLAGTSTTDQDGSGLAVLRVNPGTSEVCYTITVEDIGVPTEPLAGIGAAHIHDVATGGIWVDLETDWTQAGTGYMTTGCTEAEQSDLIALMRDPSGYYVNIHTVEFPGGAISGTLG